MPNAMRVTNYPRRDRLPFLAVTHDCPVSGQRWLCAQTACRREAERICWDDWVRGKRSRNRER